MLFLWYFKTFYYAVQGGLADEILTVLKWPYKGYRAIILPCRPFIFNFVCLLEIEF